MVSSYGDRGSYSRYLIRMNIQHMAVFYLGIMKLLNAQILNETINYLFKRIKKTNETAQS